jgi:integrase
MPVYKRKLSVGVRYWYIGQFKGIKYFSKAEYLTKQDAREAEATRLKQLEKEARRTPLTLLELCNQRLDYLLTARSKIYYKDNKRTFTRLVKAIGDIPATQVTRASLHKFFLDEANRLAKEGKSNYQVNASLRFVRALFNFAVEMEALEDNPTARLKFYPVDTKKKLIPSDAHLSKLLTACEPDERLLLAFVMTTGCRIGEAMRATYADLGENLVTLWTRKKRNSNLTPRRVPLPFSLWPQRSPELPQAARLFPEWTKQPRFLLRRCKALEIPSYGWHSLRHRFASLLAAQNRPLIEIMALLGHDNIETTQKYLQLLGL